MLLWAWLDTRLLISSRLRDRRSFNVLLDGYLSPVAVPINASIFVPDNISTVECRKQCLR